MAEKDKDLVAGDDFYATFFNEFKDESDRAAVILGTAKIDLLLHQLLTAFFLPSTETQDELLDGDAPLSTLHAKINMAYRLGFIDRRFTKALNILRKIRNAFAHEATGCTLNAGPHRDRIRELKRLFYYEDKFDSAKRIFDLTNETASDDFRMSIAFITFRLEGLIKHTKTIYVDETWELIPPDFHEIISKAELDFNKLMSKQIEAGGPTGRADGPREK